MSHSKASYHEKPRDDPKAPCLVGPSRRPIRRTPWLTRLVAVVTLSLVVLPLLPGHADAAALWRPTGSMVAFHGSTALAQLHDGRVLAISGADGLGDLTTVSEVTTRPPGPGRRRDRSTILGWPSTTR